MVDLKRYVCLENLYGAVTFLNRLILRPAIKLMDRQQCFTKRTAITNIFKYFLELHFCESKN